MKKRYPLLAGVTLIALTFTLAFSMKTEAASNRTKALKAYNRLLSKSKIATKTDAEPWVKSGKLSFALAYIDNDSVPELLVKKTNNSGFYLEYDAMLFTWRHGKVKRVTDFRYGSVGMDLADAKAVYYKKTGYFYYGGAYGERYYVKLSKGKLKYGIYAYDKYFTDNGKAEYYSASHKKISKSSFKKMKRKITKGRKASSYKWRKNTKKNRRKYLK